MYIVFIFCCLMLAEGYCKELEMTIYDSHNEISVLSQNVKQLKVREDMISDLYIHLQECLHNIPKENEGLKEQVNFFMTEQDAR